MPPSLQAIAGKKTIQNQSLRNLSPFNTLPQFAERPFAGFYAAPVPVILSRIPFTFSVFEKQKGKYIIVIPKRIAQQPEPQVSHLQRIAVIWFYAVITV